MKKLIVIQLFAILIVFCACNDKKNISRTNTADSTSIAVVDTAYYGVGGSGTSMHSLMLVSDVGDTLIFNVIPPNESYEDEVDMMMPEEKATSVMGGMPNVGDRISVTAIGDKDNLTATSIVNLTSLQGKWHSIDKEFEICEGGVINQTNQSEQNKWNEWKMTNGNLVLGTDTFAINQLSPDSLLLENKKGIYVYTR